MTLTFILLILALVMFTIPAARALLASRIDFTNTGLALVVLSWLVA